MRLRIVSSVSKNRITELLATMVVWCAFMKSAFSEQTHFILTGAGVLLGSFLLLVCLSSFKVKREVLYLLEAITVLGIFNIIFVGSMTVVNYIPMILLYLPIAIYFFYGNNSNSKYWEFNYFLYSAFLCFKMITSDDGYHLSYALSRNSLSVLLLIWLVILSVLYAKENKYLPLKDVIVFLVGCIIATGRGGIISGVMLAFCFWLIETKENILRSSIKKHKYKLKLILLFLVALITAIIFAYNFDLFYNKYMFRFTDPASIRSSDARIYIWKLYIERCQNLLIFFWGDNTYRLLHFTFNGNLHNSILMTHAKFGIIGFFYVICVFVASTALAIKTKDYRFLSIILVFFIRSLTDQIFPGKTGDIAFFMIIFYQMGFWSLLIRTKMEKRKIEILEH